MCADLIYGSELIRISKIAITTSADSNGTIAKGHLSTNLYPSTMLNVCTVFTFFGSLKIHVSLMDRDTMTLV